MLTFALIALTVVGLLTFWLHRRLVAAPRWPTRWRYAGSALIVALTVLLVQSTLVEPASATGAPPAVDTPFAIDTSFAAGGGSLAQR